MQYRYKCIKMKEASTGHSSNHTFYFATYATELDICDLAEIIDT